MPVYMEISPLHRLVTIVARGRIDAAEVRGTAQKLADARVRRFAKIVEIAGAAVDLAPADIAGLAETLRGDPDRRGPIAFVVGTASAAFAGAFAAQTAGEGPIELFKSLHDARAWVARSQLGATKPAAAPATADDLPDPDRSGTMIVGTRQRAFTTRELVT